MNIYFLLIILIVNNSICVRSINREQNMDVTKVFCLGYGVYKKKGKIYPISQSFQVIDQTMSFTVSVLNLVENVCDIRHED